MYKIKIEKEHSVIFIEIEDEPNNIELGELKEMLSKVQNMSTRTGGGDVCVIRANKILFEELIERGLINYTFQSNCFPDNGQLYDFVKKGKIVYTDLVI